MYKGTTDPNEHVTAYTCVVKGNELKDDEIESVLLKKFGETLSKGAMIWYHDLPPNSIDSSAMLVDSFVRAHAGAIKVATRESDVFKIKQRENDILREFVSRFQKERMELPPVSDDWAVQAFTQGVNERSSVPSKQLKQNFIEYPAATWDDVQNRYQSKIRVEDDQLGAPSGLVYPSRILMKEQRFAERELRLNKERYQPYVEDRRNVPMRNIPRGDRRTDRDLSSRGLMSKTGFDRHIGPMEAHRLSVYNFNVDVSHIVSAIGKIKDTRWPKPVLSDPSQRNPNLMCKYHGTHGHRTEDCRQLREEVARLISKGQLREFLNDRAKNQFWEREANKKHELEEPHHVIHMIVRGVDAP
ncbi:uncharacterized protein [Nicotiana sylvestris]|uniref:uncharacterized protein n=1 Tax=Nicotiana sylvestris TaxID=4096 RepID=UPI00388CE149